MVLVTVGPESVQRRVTELPIRLDELTFILYLMYGVGEYHFDIVEEKLQFVVPVLSTFPCPKKFETIGDDSTLSEVRNY